ncbi:MAG: hypothetical protein Q8Q09_03940 [Deltaproteobacteria bacterium]|nr:hypothetical protein [Deltaproteobacteria bacterium]
MEISSWIAQTKQSILGELEQHVYDQATANNLVDTALASLIEHAVAKLKLEMPAATGVASTLLGFLKPLMAAADSLGLDDKIAELVASHGVDAAMRDRVIAGLTRYLQDNSGRLMSVAQQALMRQLTQQ